MWMMDFETLGYSLREGEGRLLVFGIMDQVLERSRVRLVERALLDKLLQELKLGASNLSDRSTALSLGKILAARLILFGQLNYSELQTQVSMRLIETETGRITAAVRESCASALQASDLAGKLSKSLLQKMEKLYPLRGKIRKVEDENVHLNIGEQVGVRMGQRFKIVDRDVIIEVISTQPDTSLAKIEKGKELLKEGLRVEGLPVKSES